MAGNYSVQRETIYQVLKSTKTHPSADWVYRRCRDVLPGIGLATVYRNLELLVEQGRAIKINVAQGKDRYDADVTPHFHTVCPICGKVSDCDTDGVIAKSLDGECERRGYQGWSLIFTDVCPDCRSTKQIKISRSDQ